MDTPTLIQEALILPEGDRMRLVERLLESLTPEAEGSDEAFQAELQCRSAEIDDGQAELIPWDDLRPCRRYDSQSGS